MHFTCVYSCYYVPPAQGGDRTFTQRGRRGSTIPPHSHDPCDTLAAGAQALGQPRWVRGWGVGHYLEFHHQPGAVLPPTQNSPRVSTAPGSSLRRHAAGLPPPHAKFWTPGFDLLQDLPLYNLAPDVTAQHLHSALLCSWEAQHPTIPSKPRCHLALCAFTP